MAARRSFAIPIVITLAVALLGLKTLALLQARRLADRATTVADRLERAARAAASRQVSPPTQDTSAAAGGRTTGSQVTIAPARTAQTWEPTTPIGSDDTTNGLVWALRSEPRTLNPLRSEADIYTRYVTVPLIFESLFEPDWDDPTVLRPHLAQGFEWNDDHRTLVVTLRPDIRFSDGRPLTADDVAFTFDWIHEPTTDARSAVPLDFIERTDVIDPHTVRFTLNRPHWKALEWIGRVPILPHHVYGDPQADIPVRKPDQGLNDSPTGHRNAAPDPRDSQPGRRDPDHPIGTGPYVFDHWTVGQEIVLHRNDGYWGRKPDIARHVFRFIRNDLAAMQALQAHRIDVMIPSPEQFAQASTDSSFAAEHRAVAYPSCWAPYMFIVWNLRQPMFADRRVRLAMTYLVDRRTVVDRFMEGQGRVVTGPFCADGPQADPSIRPWPYDPARGAALLDETGWIDTDGDGIRDRDGRPLRFRYSYPAGYALYEQTAKLFKDAAARIGVDVVPDPYEWSVFFDRLRAGRFDAATMGWAGEYETDPYDKFHSTQIAGGNNFGAFSNPQVDTILEAARIAWDPTERNALYHRLHRILHDEQPYTFLFTRPVFRFVDKRIRNVIVHRRGLNPLEWTVEGMHRPNP